MTKNKITEISVLLSDCYKFGHRVLYPENTTYVYSTLTPRENSYFPYSDKMVVFGYEMFVQRWLVEHFNENFFDLDIDTVVEQYHYVVSTSLGEQNADASHIRELHKLGYLPILIKALPEGTLAPMKVPVLTIENTHDDFAWLTNFLETLLISETFVTSTVASMALAMKKVAVKYGLETAETLDHIAYQCHDFSERGQHGNGAAQLSGIGHLTSFVGSDTIQAAVMAHNYYGADLAKENILKSVVASEHSVMQAYGVDEVHTYKTLMERHPDGILSLVSDTYDYYGVLTNVLPTLHKEVMARNGKVVIRPDCYDSETSILTDKGWKLFVNLENEDLVAQVTDEGRYEFVKPLKYTNTEYKGKMIHFQDHHGKVNLLVTPNHRMIIESTGSKNGKVINKVVEAKDLKTGNSSYSMRRSAKAKEGKKLIAPLERLKIAFQADGSFCSSGVGIRFSFKKGRKISRLKEILKACELKYAEYALSDGKVEFNIKVNGKLFSKDFSWVDLSTLDNLWCAQFIEELSYWDASRRNDSRFKFDTTSKEVSDVVEIVAISAGYGVLQTTYADNRSEKFSNIYTSHITLDNKVGGQSWKKEEVEYEGMIHCVTVPSGKIIVKRGRGTMVCGNSGNPVDIIAGVKAIDVSSVKPWEVDALLNIMNRKINISKPVLLVRDGNYSLAEVDISPFNDRLFVKSSKQHELTPEDKGSLELLWEQFGGTVNSKGYKVLDPHVGLLYGEGITVDRMAEIFDRMKEKGFSSENVVFGVGAYVYSVQISRDSFAQAIKSQMVTIDGEDKMIFKNPKTDVNHIKRSLAGKVVVLEIGGKLVVESGYPKEYENPRDLLQPIFENGEVLRNTPFKVIRDRLDKEANSLG